jgi:hypothetical protein
MDSIASPKVKIMKGEGVGVRPLARNTSKVEGRDGAPGWDWTSDKLFNYSHELAQTKQQVG